MRKTSSYKNHFQSSSIKMLHHNLLITLLLVTKPISVLALNSCYYKSLKTLLQQCKVSDRKAVKSTVDQDQTAIGALLRGSAIFFIIKK